MVRMGTITPIESGYYRQNLVRVNGTWLIESLRIATICRWRSEEDGCNESCRLSSLRLVSRIAPRGVDRGANVE